MFDIYNKTFKTPIEALGDVIAYILVEEPEAIGDKELLELMVLAHEHGLTEDIIEQMGMVFYQEVWGSYSTRRMAHRLAFSFADMTKNYPQAHRPFCTKIV